MCDDSVVIQCPLLASVLLWSNQIGESNRATAIHIEWINETEVQPPMIDCATHPQRQ